MRSKYSVNLFAVLLVFVLGVIDYLSGYEISFSIFYLIPILLSSWYTGLGGAVFISLASAAAWLAADLLWEHSYSHFLIPYWNATVRLGFFLIVSYTVSRMRMEFAWEKQLARTDNTTRLANGRHFLELTELELRKLDRYGHPLTLAYMDVDNFKTVNDTLGHDAGDALLRLIAGVIKRNIRSTDIAARIGGDEFTVLFPGTSLEQARSVVAKLQDHLVEAVRTKGYPVTVSIGAVTFTSHPPSVNEALKTADNLMYTAKKQGKNRAQFKRVGGVPEPVLPGKS